MASGLFRVRLNEAIAEVERELQLRRTFYPGRVRTGVMSKIAMNRRIDRMKAARDFLDEMRTEKGGEYEGRNIKGSTEAVD